MCITPTFFCPVQTLRNLVPGASSLYGASKSENIPEKSLDFTASFISTVDARVEGLVSKVHYLKNWCCDFIQKKYARKRRLPHTHVSFFGP